MTLLDRIRQLGEAHAIDLIGVAGLSKYAAEIEEIGGSLVRDYPRALSIGIVIPNDIVNLLEDRESYENVFQYKMHGYDILNQRLDIFSSMTSSLIQKGGYRAMPIPAAERIDTQKAYASISHKITARLAGFGWIGKSCLLIHPEYGPRVRWTTVLTDAPLEENQTILETQCGDCHRCVDLCPANAIRGRNYADGESREMRLDVAKCGQYFRGLVASNKLAVCGMCLYACPHGR